ncbi:MAG: WXG100 family type VII secretion target [Roseiflexus sp.]
MPLISLDSDQARTTASTLDGSKNSIESELNRMIGSANEVMATWSGSSRQQFEAQWEQWCQQLRTMMEELQGLANGLRREADEFESVDRSFLSA